ncbi:MAG: M90 family metallopeptidase [Acidobacteriota bacterium]
MTPWILIALAFVFGGLALVRMGLGRRRRQRLLARPFSEEWRRILERNVPLVARLSAEKRQRLEELIRAFLVDVPIEGGGGLEIDDEIRVTVAAQACLLVLGNGHSFPNLRSVVVYPEAYRAVNHDAGGDLVVSEHHRLGESWSNGYVVLAWDAVRRGATNLNDGHNVVMHEFAHQLDQLDGDSDGIPVAAGRLRYGHWARVVERDFEHLVARVERNQRTVLDPYGAENPAEFFAVATEAFFERPKKLRRRYPELYALLEDLYQLDPIAWH